MTKDSGAYGGGWRLGNSYSQLPEIFYSNIEPIPVSSPKLIVLNHALAESLGLDVEVLMKDDSIDIFAGNRVPPGSKPLAQAYAGHQFGHFTMLGDGRAILLGEQITPKGERFDVQLKGSGRTPYSRGGDGRAVLGPMLREYIISEAMYALGIPTTRSLAVVTTGEKVYRGEDKPGAVLTRVADSHIRVGTFEYAARWGTINDLKALADYTLERHFSSDKGMGYPGKEADFDSLDYSDCVEGSGFDGFAAGPRHQNKCENKYVYLLREVIRRQAELITKWQMVGFIHGVMNTDNMALSGETIDYGPCAFMDTYDPDTVFSSIDTNGRYAYGNQPLIAAWNLSRFAETLLPLLHDDEEKAVELAQYEVSKFNKLFYDYWLDGMRAKLGIFNDEAEDDDLIRFLLGMMISNRADFTNTFRILTEICGLATDGEQANNDSADSQIFTTSEFVGWKEQWQARLSRQSQSMDEAHMLMTHNNPSVIPRNHRVEEALEAADRDGDYSILQKLLSVISNLYVYTVEHELYSTLPAPSVCPYRTYCGT